MTTLSAFLLAAACVAGLAPPPAGPVGIWKCSRQRPATANDPPSVSWPGAGAFRYDGRSVYVYLLSMRHEIGDPEDGVYRFRARWEGNTLRFRELDGGWKRWATFVDGRFLIRCGNVVW